MSKSANQSGKTTSVATQKKKPDSTGRKTKAAKPSAELQKVDYDTKLDLYRQRAKDLAAKSHGLERFIYSLFGEDLIGSWALALDPWERFTFTTNKVAKLTDVPSHHRKRLKVSTQYSTRFEYWKRLNTSYGYTPDNSTPYPFDYLLTGPNNSVVTQGTTNRGDQPVIIGFVRDFTEKTRGIGITQGEFEIFDPVWKSHPISFTYQYQNSHVQNHIGTGLQNSQTIKTDIMYTRGPEIVCDKATTLALESDCRSRALSVMAKNALGMLDKCLPQSKDYNLFYQITELKDLPQTIRGTLQIWLAFERYCGTELFRTLQHNVRSWRNPELIKRFESILGRKTGFHWDIKHDLDQAAANAYLTFKFGWQSMVQAVSQLLKRPEEITKRVNFLIKNIGRDVSFRTKRKWTEPVSSTPNFTGNLLHFESLDTNPTHPLNGGHRDVELRCMANVHINFPQVDIPKLRTTLFYRKLGAYPTVSDIYDIVPWTWMIDWFSGLGDYVHLMDTLHTDKSLVNYSFMTYKEVAHIQARFTGKFVGTRSTNFDGSSSSDTITYKKDHSGELTLKYVLRKSMSEVAKVKTYWDSDLSGTQKAIIGALSVKYGSGIKHRA